MRKHLMSEQVGMGNKKSARMGAVELMQHVPAQINSTAGRKNSPTLGGRMRRGGAMEYNVLAAFLHKFAFPFERSGKPRFQHGLIVRVQIHQHFFKRIVQFGGDFPPHHGPAFPNSGGSFGIGGMAFGAQRTFAFNVKLVIGGCRSKSKYRLPCRYLRRNFKGNPAAGRYFNRLLDGHKASVA